MARTVTFCIINLKCKNCGKHRHQGFFYRHSSNLRSGTNTSRTCEICTNYRKYQDRYTYEEYEKLRLTAFENWRLGFLGKKTCLRCGEVFDLSEEVKSKSWCPSCRNKYRSQEAIQEKYQRWGVSNEKDYLLAKNNKLFDKKLRELCALSTSNFLWNRWAYRYWLANASKKEISTVFIS